MDEDKKKVPGGVGPAGSLMLGLLIPYDNAGKEVQHWPRPNLTRIGPKPVGPSVTSLASGSWSLHRHTACTHGQPSHDPFL